MTELDITHLEHEKTPLDTVLIFGQGPVLERETKEVAGKVDKGPGSEGVNLWSLTSAQAAAELYNQGQMREIIIMGGRTGGPEYGSEAELIAGVLQTQYGVPESALKLEHDSTNTLENMVNMINLYIDTQDGKGAQQKIGVLAGNYHVPRVKLLMRLFGLPYKAVFSAEEVVRYAAYKSGSIDHATLTDIEDRLDFNAVKRERTWLTADEKVPNYYDSKQGTETKSIVQRGEEEDVFVRAIIEMPAYWIGYLGRLRNPARMRHGLQFVDPAVLTSKFNIHLDIDSDESIREKLLGITRELPSLQEWQGRPWSAETKQTLEQLIDGE